MIEVRRIAIWCLYGLLAWGSAIATVGVANISITKLNLLVPIIMGAYFAVIVYFRKHCGKREVRYGLIFSIPFALSLVLGSNVNMESTERLYIWNLPLNVLYFCLLAVMGMVAVASLLVFLKQKNITVHTVQYSPRTIGIITFILCMIAWMPYFLTYCPGIISNDAIWIIEQGIGIEPLSNHHPILFTLFMKLILTVGTSFLSLNGAVGLFCVVHMMLFAGALSYITYWLTRRNASKEVLILTILYFALNPVIGLYSVYLTKDIFFSCLLVIFVLQLYDVVKTKGTYLSGKKQVFGLFLVGLGIIFLRNNGLLIVVVTFFVLFMLYKVQWKAIFVCMGLCVGISAFVKGPIFTIMDIPPSPFVESMSIPLQQIGQVIVEDGSMTEEQSDYLNEILPFEQVKEVYLPGYTDPYKFHADFDTDYLDETKSTFLRVWASILPSHLDAYIEAYLMQTIGYWHIGQSTSLSTYGVIENELGIEQVNFIENLTGVSLEPLIEQMMLAVRKAPVINIVTNMAGILFGILLLTVLSCYRKRGRIALTLLPIWILWGTILLATPAYCLFRYMFVLSLILPYLGYILQELLCKGIIEDEK